MTVQKPDFRKTVFLPQTDFPMKAGLAAQEPQWLAHWEQTGAYARLRAARKGCEKFILHDGPPYANGDIHTGHALNKTIKDVVVRTQNMLGKDAPYVPGWDCHGLPIEWKIEEKYRAKKLNKDEVDPVEFRRECRDFAAHWVDVQREQFKRLGIWGDWDNPYLTMNYQSEAVIVSELLKFVDNGLLYRGAKPVMWSPVEKTALAEAEIEYADVVSTQIDVAFEIIHCPLAPELVGAYAVIWTTTPWTIPVNRAIAYGEEVEFVLLEGGNGRRFLIAEALVAAFSLRLAHQNGDKADFRQSWAGKGGQLAGALCRHPFAGAGALLRQAQDERSAPGERARENSAHPEPVEGSSASAFFDEPRPMLPGDFVTTEQGTGLVHMAPDHGEDDFELCKAYGIEPKFIVQADGTYAKDWPLVGGLNVINAKTNAPDGVICTALRERGALLAASDFAHSYPHSWRSKKKVIYRCTPQWFVAMDRPAASGTTLRTTALQAISDTRWVPGKGINRIRAMVEGRPDWVLSRQRAWGAPMTLFVHNRTGAVLNDKAVNARILAAIAEQGADAWYTTPAQTFLGNDYVAEDYEQVFDILDVWFDSGSTHAFVMEARDELHRDAHTQVMYMEGSDQHRGWFQSSLLESCATRGRAPFDIVMTHGMTLDGKGMKMSKSIGNTIDPMDIIKEHGADILRLWAMSVDYLEDHRISKEIIGGAVDSYRKIRNTLRYLLGALHGFSTDEQLDHGDMPALERWVLHRVSEVDAQVRQAAHDFEFTTLFTTVYQFCVQDLSAFYFDIRKDSLYCDAVTSVRRRAARTVIDLLFDYLVKWLAPILVFTCEEAWASRHGMGEDSVHLHVWPTPPAQWQDTALGALWAQVREVRSAVTAVLEVERREKRIGSSLESAPVIDGLGELAPLDWAEICITSAFTTSNSTILGVRYQPAPGHKCGRCWRILPEVGQSTAHPELCLRCEAVVTNL